MVDIYTQNLVEAESKTHKCTNAYSPRSSADSIHKPWKSSSRDVPYLQHKHTVIPANNIQTIYTPTWWSSLPYRGSSSLHDSPISSYQTPARWSQRLSRSSEGDGSLNRHTGSSSSDDVGNSMNEFQWYSQHWEADAKVVFYPARVCSTVV